MNFGRSNHSSCCLGDNIYVFCGIGESNEPINSIEMLENAASEVLLGRLWVKINFSMRDFPPRWIPAVTALDNTIAVSGGFTTDEVGEDGVMGDVILFDPINNNVDLKVKNIPGLI